MTFRLSLSLLIIIICILYILSTTTLETDTCSTNKKFIVPSNPDSGSLVTNPELQASNRPNLNGQDTIVSFDVATAPLQSAWAKSESILVRGAAKASHQIHVDESPGASSASETGSTSSDPNPTLSLPPLDDAAVGGMEQHQIPTFNEFHAMLSENGDPKPLKGGSNNGHTRIPTVREEKQSSSPPQTSHLNPPVPPESDSASSSQLGLSPDQQTANSHNTDVPATPGHGGSSHASDSPGVSNPDIESIDSLAGRLDEVKLNAVLDPEISLSGEIESGEQQLRSQQQQQYKHHSQQMATDRSVTLRRNVASVACGAKLLESSPAMKNAEAVLNSNNDEYMNVPCSSEKWFVIEVCEPVQLRMIELANYELFSSRVKSFNVFVSDRFPAKSWELVGRFVARDIKGLQNFHVSGDKLIKYVKFELLEQYGSEHYCPLTMIRLFGLVSDDLDDDDDEVEAQVAAAAARVGSQKLDVVQPGDVATGSGIAEVDSTNQSSTDAPGPVGETDQSVLNNRPKTEELSKADPHDMIVESSLTSGTESPVADPRLITRPKPDHTQFTGSRADAVDPSVVFIRQGGVADDPDTSIPIINKPDSTIADTVLAHISSEKPKHCQSTGADPCPARGDLGELEKSPPGTSSVSSLNPETVEPHRPPLEVTGRDPVTSLRSAQQGTNTLPPGSRASKPATDESSTSDVPVLSNSAPADEYSSSKSSRGTFFQRVKGIIHLIYVPPQLPCLKFIAEETEVNLSQVPICSRHLEAVASLQIYGLLNTSCQTDPLQSSPQIRAGLLLSQLDKSKQLGVTQLERCLFYLYNLTQPTDLNAVSAITPDSSLRAGVGLALSFSQLRLKQYPGLWSCLDASKRLDLVLNQSPGRDAKFRYSISRLFIAFQYRERLHARSNPRFLSTGTNNARDLTIFSNGVGELQQFDPLWHILSSNSMQWISQCPKIPEFLLTTEAPDAESPPSPLTGIGRQSGETSSNRIQSLPLSVKLNVNHSPSHSWVSPPGATREEIVVPAALTGSRKDTLLMRLNNRVRLLERNVSVSMRYLEELSQSYRRQMERLSRSFNLTAAWLKATQQGAAERDQLQQCKYDAELRPDHLRKSVSSSSPTSSPTNVSDSAELSDQSHSHSLHPATSSSTLLPASTAPPLPPPPPAFDAALDWTATYGPWAQLEDEWLDEDGVVETEGEDNMVDGDYVRTSHNYRQQSIVSRNRYDGRVIDPVSRDGVFSSTSAPKSSRSGSSSRSVAASYGSSSAHISDSPSGYMHQTYIDEVALFSTLLDWLQLITSWFSTPWSYISLVLPNHWMPRMIPLSNNTIGMIYMALLHLMFAVLSHLLIYWTWLRPCSRKFQSGLLALPSSSYSSSPSVQYKAQPYTDHHVSEYPVPRKRKDNPVRSFTQFPNWDRTLPAEQHANKSRGSHRLVDTLDPSDAVIVGLMNRPSMCSQKAVSNHLNLATKSVEWDASVPIARSAPSTPHVTRTPFSFPVSSPPIDFSMYGSRKIVKPTSVVATAHLGPFVESMAPNEPVFLSTSSSNRSSQSGPTEPHALHNGCDGTDQSQAPRVSSLCTVFQPKLSKNAVRRRNRRERAKRHSTQQVPTV
ncbi:SUN domain-containing ossification factor [Fasciola gigantica]|uniref:SUN domain-containing ossification factor n=1 Tax=Fasciola gigantica TaxID=46835 RepID=A0A504YTJ6_FASGI|nr:SUN domain-containing ossification factor [Fasciola gigantica]